jgi:hypothetical protein
MLNIFLLIGYNIKRFEIFIPIVAIIWLVGGNALFIFLFIRSAVKKYVKPNLQSSGLIFVRSRWAGLFNSGDFGNAGFSFKPSFLNGNPFLSIYAYIYYKEFDVIKRFTIRIDTLFFFIRNVTFSSEILNK